MISISFYWLTFGYLTVDLAGRYGASAQLVRAMLSVIWILWVIFLVLGAARGVRS